MFGKDDDGRAIPNTLKPAQDGIDEVVDPERTVAAYEAAELDVLAKNANLRAAARTHGYEPLRSDEAELWHRRFSTRTALYQLLDHELDEDLVAELKRAREAKVFTSIQCWSVDINRSKSREQVFVGVIGSEQVLDPTTYYIIGQYIPPTLRGKQRLTTTKDLRNRYKHFDRAISFSTAQPRSAKLAFGVCLGALMASVSAHEIWQSMVVTLTLCLITYCAQYPLTDHEEDFAEELRVAVFFVGLAQVIAFVIGLLV